MDPNNLSVGLAFIAGLVSFLSPCVLSLVPAYVGYLGSRAITAQGEIIENRWGTVLTLALNANDIGRGVVLLSAYSLGLGIPFLMAAAGIGRVSQLLRRYGKYMRYMSFVAGLFLIGIGLLLFTDLLQVFARYAFVSNFQTYMDEGLVTFWQRLTRGGQ